MLDLKKPCQGFRYGYCETGFTDRQYLLFQEFQRLKTEIFGNNRFVVLEDTPRQLRYDQLLAYFYPCFQTKDWVDPEFEKGGG